MDWLLPSIDDGNAVLKEMSVQIDPLLADNVKLGEKSTSLVYDGKPIAGLTTEIQIVKINISLVNAHGTSSYV